MQHTPEFTPRVKRYLRAVSRRLRLPRAVRSRVVSDLSTSIAARLEAGESEDAVLLALGAPAAAAAELNEQMQEFAFRKSPWRFVCLALAILAGLWLIGFCALPALVLAPGRSVGVIGSADGPTAIFLTGPNAPGAALYLALALAALGAAGFFYLGHLKRK